MLGKTTVVTDQVYIFVLHDENFLHYMKQNEEAATSYC